MPPPHLPGGQTVGLGLPTLSLIALCLDVVLQQREKGELGSPHLGGPRGAMEAETVCVSDGAQEREGPRLPDPIVGPARSPSGHLPALE